MPQTRIPQVSPNSKFRDGSVGSKIETDNPTCPPSKVSTSDVMKGNRSHETREQHKDNRGGLPKETDHPLESSAIINNCIHEDSPEMVRRQNNHARDNRTGFRVTENRVYPDNA